MKSERNNRFKKCHSLIDELLNELRPPSDAWIDSVKSEWTSIVGPVIAAHTAPQRIEGPVLIVKVSNHIWRNELRSGIGRDIEQKVHCQICCAITRIRWEL